MPRTYDVVVHCAVIGGSRLKKDEGDVMWKNILMFENVVRVFKGKLIYFSSGAALRGNPPTDPYGLSKWIIDRRIDTIPNTQTRNTLCEALFCLCILYSVMSLISCIM